MKRVDFTEWKRLAIARKERHSVGPFEQRNITEGQDSRVEVYDGDKMVARMIVYQSNTKKMAYDCKRRYEIDEDLLEEIKGIYIPDPEWQDSLEDAYNDRGEWEDNANWLVYCRSVEEGTPDPGWIPEDFPQELVDAFHRKR